MQWLAAHHPQLVPRYEALYSGGSYASKEYRDWLSGRIRLFRGKHGLTAGAGFFRNLSPAGQQPPAAVPPAPSPTGAPDAVQAALF